MGCGMFLERYRYDAVVLAQVVSVKEFAVTREGRWNKHWYLCKTQRIWTLEGTFNENELNFTTSESWPAPGSGIKVRKNPFPYEERKVFLFYIRTGSPCQIVAQGQRSWVEPYGALIPPNDNGKSGKVGKAVLEYLEGGKWTRLDDETPNHWIVTGLLETAEGKPVSRHVLVDKTTFRVSDLPAIPPPKANAVPLAPTKYGMLSFEDLVGESGMLDSIENDSDNFFFKFKTSGGEYSYGYLQPIAIEPGGEVAVRTGERFRFSGDNVSLNLAPLPDRSLTKDGFALTIDRDLRASGKGVIRLDGYLVVSKRGAVRGKNAVMTRPAVPDAYDARSQNKGKRNELRHPHLFGKDSPFESISFDGTRFHISFKEKSYPIDYYLENTRRLTNKQKQEPIPVPVGTAFNLWHKYTNYRFLPLPEPLRKCGLDARIGDYSFQEGFILFTEGDAGGKREMFITEPYLAVAIDALAEANKKRK